MKRLYMLLAIVGLAWAGTAFAGDVCDYTGDGVCDQDDQAEILGAMGTQEGDAGFIAAADLDGDGVISPADLSRFLDISGR